MQAESRPAQPTKFEEWLGRARRQTDVWCLVYGKEWRPVRAHALKLMEEWHAGAPHKWPLAVIIEVWEELHWRFGEELKEELRKLKKLAGRETLTLQDLRFHALMPNTDGLIPFNMPRTFDLLHPDGWFLTEVQPRIERRQERMLWKMTWEGNKRPAGPGGVAGGEEPRPAERVEKEKPAIGSWWGLSWARMR